ncbi:hypothetical protein BDQ17DRAFT_1425853 [Cyathus striatus]|nr:hypothetical protein BDQ17DRAFT_1425853 [Cyathus striatus]
MLHGPEFTEQDAIDWGMHPVRIHSETIHFLRSVTDIPIPAIFSTNITELPVGAPYSIQELATGANLVVPMWEQLSGAQQLTVVQKLGEITGKLYSLEFDSYGSIIDGTSGAIGPLIDPVYCIHHPYPPLGIVGPWRKDDPFGMFVSFATREYHWLKSDLGKRLFMKIYDGRDGTRNSNSSPAFTLSFTPIALRPTLAHPDYTFANILISDVDPTQITGIVDWEYAAILPLWYTHSMLGNIEYVGEELYINNPHISKEEEDMLRDAYIKAISQRCSDFQVLLSDTSDWKWKASVLHDIILLAGKGNMLRAPIAMIKDRLTFALSKADCTDHNGIGILDGIIKLLSVQRYLF